MHKLISIIFLFSISGVFSQSIENVDFRLEGKSIVVTYDFFHPKADTAINVELVFKDQQGGVITPKTISGAIKNVKPGESKRIVWDVLSDGISLSGKYKAEVKIIRSNSVKIGNQVWMNENLNVDRFQNGDIIKEAKTAEEWINAGKNKQAAWCHYDNDPANDQKYAKLYNWYAVNDPRGLAPAGWHVPSDSEWTALSTFLGGEEVAGKKMKSTSGWDDNGNGTNSSGFSGLPGGYRSYYGDFANVGGSGHWWSASESYETAAWSRRLSYYYSDLNRSDYSKDNGFSVRCVRDSLINLNSVKIGNQVWTNENLNVDHFRNGDIIPETETAEEWKAAGNAKRPAWCYYNNILPATDRKIRYNHDKLYNWYAVKDTRGLAPAGWHVPSDAEWTILSLYLGGESVSGAKMKSTSGWSASGNCSNSSGFSGLPGGYREGNGYLTYIGQAGYWWSASEADVSNAWGRQLYYNISSLAPTYSNKNCGFSVRCVKD
jgi:uncharacterized protein (TIGR02145 family)